MKRVAYLSRPGVDGALRMGEQIFRVSGREAEKTEGSDGTWRKKEKS